MHVPIMTLIPPPPILLQTYILLPNVMQLTPHLTSILTERLTCSPWTHTRDFSRRYCSRPAPTILPLGSNINWMNLPNRLELSLSPVCALPNASRIGLSCIVGIVDAMTVTSWSSTTSLQACYGPWLKTFDMPSKTNWALLLTRQIYILQTTD